MNKTMKTIAWICLVLGLLGVAADAAALVYGRALFERRSEQLAESHEKIRDSYGGWRENPCLSEDGEGEIVVDRECLEERGINRRAVARRMMPGRRFTERIPRPSGASWIFPLLLFATGPVLVVVGSVMLIVNREPKTYKEEKEEPEPKKK